MKTMQEWFDKYAEHHQNPVNKLIHWICVPSIFFSIIGMLSALSFSFPSKYIPTEIQGVMHVGTLLILFGIVFFYRLSVKIALGMLLVSIIILNTITFMEEKGLNVLVISAIVFVVAWIGQFIGHKIEGAKPSFMDDLKFLLIGPAWLLSFIYKAFGIKY